MSMPWFKIFSEARNDPKLESLTDAQHRVWFRLICFSSEQTERGTITGYDDLDLLALEVSRGDTDLLHETLCRLVKLRIIAWSEDDCNRTEFINFAKRQARKPSDETPAVTTRKQNQRARDKQSAANVTPSNKVDNVGHAMSRDVTPIEEDVDVDREEDQEEDTFSLTNIRVNQPTVVVKPTIAAFAATNGARPPEQQGYSPQFEDFWKCYPRRDGTKRGSKADAWREWRKLKVPQQLAAGELVDVYAKLDSTRAQNGKYIVDAERWLREKRWETAEEEALAEAQQRVNGENQNDNPRTEYRTSSEKNSDNLERIARRWQTTGLGADYSPSPDVKFIARR